MHAQRIHDVAKAIKLQEKRYVGTSLSANQFFDLLKHISKRSEKISFADWVRVAIMEKQEREEVSTKTKNIAKATSNETLLRGYSTIISHPDFNDGDIN